MSKEEKVLLKVLRGTSDANVAFSDLCLLLRHLNFDERIKGSHHIFTRTGIPEILNLQPKGGKAKAYQVKQVRDVILRYRLADEDDDE
ncbi:MAG: type II toxin-antitoxin system HicA family toxin [Anaerolineae bacterium]|nr:type II toxin-antitoxin system HicA family toxin [Anaerolineae bacterium]